MSPDNFYEIYRNSGFFFPKSILTTYCISLFTKPFVILSGISGTGKTKIAQLFSIPDYESKDEKKDSTKLKIPGNWIVLHLTEKAMYGDGRANFKYGDLETLLTREELEEIEPERLRLIEQGLKNNYSAQYDLTIDTPEEGEIKAKFYLQRPQSPLVRVRFLSKRGEEEYDSRQYFKRHYEVDDIIQLERIDDKKLRIVSVNDKDVRDKYDQLEKEERKFIDNQCFISVKSDWTDSTYLFGFYNLIEQKYHVTRLLKFILAAKENPNIPFFVILDEMNLSKVEYYFSDFLSCLESRFYKDEEISQEGVQLHSASGLIETDDDYFDVIPGEVKLPLNLFVTGTVNIDETTYMFSPKVLDRANVIEFNKVDFENYEENGAGDTEAFVLREFPDFREIKLASKKDYLDLRKEAKDVLKQIHSLLAKYNLHFGYRTINEVSLYVNNCLKYIDDSTSTLLKSLDYQIVQKIFPKLHGGHSKLDLPLRELIKILIGSDIDIEKIDLDFVEQINPNETKYPVSVNRIKRLYKNLVLNGFASFVE